jgi:transcriptional regulator with XRE-family HTH domain
MEIGNKLRELRKECHFSQADIEKKSGLLQCYVSRVEKGCTIPNIESLEKFANALGIPLYRLFTDDESISMPKLFSTKRKSARRSDGKLHPDLRLFAKAFRGMDERRQSFLVDLAREMARRHNLPRRIKSSIVNKKLY